MTSAMCGAWMGVGSIIGVLVIVLLVVLILAADHSESAVVTVVVITDDSHRLESGRACWARADELVRTGVGGSLSRRTMAWYRPNAGAPRSGVGSGGAVTDVPGSP